MTKREEEKVETNSVGRERRGKEWNTSEEKEGRRVRGKR